MQDNTQAKLQQLNSYGQDIYKHNHCNRGLINSAGGEGMQIYGDHHMNFALHFTGMQTCMPSPPPL